ncbi:MAG: Rid family hydrolase [Thaumarchaeota archaeon]|nr:Rid family hydrolase [Nitrososphaerota archaeon]
MNSTIHFENPKGVQKVPGYSQAGYFETPGRIIYISGQVSRNEKGETIGVGDLEEQTRQAYRNISTI